MKISFDNEGFEYVEITRSRKPGHVYITIAARQAGNPLERIVNTAEISNEEFRKLAAFSGAKVVEADLDRMNSVMIPEEESGGKNEDTESNSSKQVDE